MVFCRFAQALTIIIAPEIDKIASHNSRTKSNISEGGLEIHRILGDKVRIYRRRRGGNWHCSTYLKSREWRRSTKEKSLSRAKDVAED